jgi:hypothetical protein
MTTLSGRVAGRFAALLLGVSLLSACESPMETRALLVAAHSAEKLQAEQELPTLPWFVARIAPRLAAGGGANLAALETALDQWDVALAPDRSSPLEEAREAAYGLALPLLLVSLTRADLDDARSALDNWTARATGIVADTPLQAVELNLGRARGLNAVAGNRAELGEWEAALRAILAAADLLLETTPRLIALRLTAAGEETLARDPDGPANLSASLPLQRAQRLLRGAREALAAGDHTLAIRRAFYARQLLEP